MDYQAIENKIVEKLQEVLETVKEIATGEDLAGLGLDSIRSVALIVELEEAFDIMFDDEELLFENFSTLNKISERVIGKLESDDKSRSVVR